MIGRRRAVGAIAGALLLLGIALIGVSLAGLRPAPTPMSAPWWTSAAAIERGAHDFATGSCISCHTIAGVSNATGGANLTYEGRRRAVPWLAHELAHPTSQRPAIPRGQLRDLVAYLASLR